MDVSFPLMYTRAMVTKDQIDAVIAQWGATDQASLPPELRSPGREASPTADEFALAFALMVHQKWQDRTGPIYNDRNELIGWRGVGLKGGRS